MENDRDAGFKEDSLPQGEVVTPQPVLLNAWFSDMERFGELAGAHELAVAKLREQGYTYDQIDEFCRLRDETLRLWQEADD